MKLSLCASNDLAWQKGYLEENLKLANDLKVSIVSWWYQYFIILFSFFLLFCCYFYSYFLLVDMVIDVN